MQEKRSNIAIFNVLINLFILVIAASLFLTCIEWYLVWDDNHPYDEQHILNVGKKKYRLNASKEALLGIDGAVVFLGDSFTHGGKCGHKGCFPGVFAQRAKEEGIPYTAINLGVRGAYAAEYAPFLERYLADAKDTPRGIVVALYLNDIDYNGTLCELIGDRYLDLSVSNEDLHEIKAFCARRKTMSGKIIMEDEGGFFYTVHMKLKRTKTYRFLIDRAGALMVTNGIGVGWGTPCYPKRWQTRKGLHFQQLRYSLMKVKEVAVNHSLPLLVVIYPDIVNISEKNPFVGILAKAAESLQKDLKVPVFSGYEAFLTNPNTKKNMRISLSDRHPNCDAHQIFGDWVYEKYRGLFSHEALGGAVESR